MTRILTLLPIVLSLLAGGPAMAADPDDHAAHHPAAAPAATAQPDATGDTQGCPMMMSGRAAAATSVGDAQAMGHGTADAPGGGQMSGGNGQMMDRGMMHCTPPPPPVTADPGAPPAGHDHH